MKKLTIAIIVVGLAVFGMVYAQEQQSFKMPCGDTKNIFTRLKSEYGEQPLIIGREFVQPKDSMSLWINPETMVWTILLSRGNTTCIVGTGTDLKVLGGNKI